MFHGIKTRTTQLQQRHPASALCIIRREFKADWGPVVAWESGEYDISCIAGPYLKHGESVYYVHQVSTKSVAEKYPEIIGPTATVRPL